MRIYYQKTKKGNLVEAIINLAKPKICWGIDKEGGFGCKKKIYFTEEYDDNGKRKSQTPVELSKNLLGENIWINHWMLCPFEKRFHKLYSKK